ncbi:hypothetical protein E1N52_40365 [Paraburkholderia guartelaensis]|uniref:Uncharacterized protein n=1 Tax=Paraburkholderia guartelaensis TaxID=2546446 RepID=A0A4R5L1D8_9BURK|nr:hypothetical protein [Paraburkholderia guartelaensis]TDG02306.1 hypothetical protein E1N52_40365 [Paraburkholderia guartelaensis]
MEETEVINSTECREVIRQRAFELADTGIFDDWEAIRRALCSRFQVTHLYQIFSSPFCRMDIDRRCRTARTGRSQGVVTSVADGRHQKTKPHRAHRASSRLPVSYGPKRYDDPETRTRRPGLAGAIAAALADGSERTATQLAQQLGAGQREVQRALREMLSNDEVHVARRAPRAMCGRPARLFASGPQIKGGCDGAVHAISCWPKADPVVLRAMDAFSRHG